MGRWGDDAPPVAAALAAIEAVTDLLVETSFIATFTQRFCNAR